MKNPALREMMTKLYRLVEKYEESPCVKYSDDAVKYFTQASHECASLYNEYKEFEYAKAFLIAFYDALDKNFKKTNELPLKEREQESEQIRMC